MDGAIASNDWRSSFGEPRICVICKRPIRTNTKTETCSMVCEAKLEDITEKKVE